MVAHEPMRGDNPLRSAPHCVFTPHIGWASVAARRRLVAAAAENVLRFLQGEPRHVVNVAAVAANAEVGRRSLDRTVTSLAERRGRTCAGS